MSNSEFLINGIIASQFLPPSGLPETSPFQITSPDATRTTTISVSNSGSTVIDSELDLRFANSDGNVFFSAPDGSLFTISVENGGNTNFQTVGTAQLNIISDGITTIAPISESTGDGSLRIKNGSGCPLPSNFVTYVGGQSSGGLTIGNLQTYGYITGVSTDKVIDFDPQGLICTIGSANSDNGTILNIDGTQGLSRVTDQLYNPVVGGASGSFTLAAFVPSPAASGFFLLKTFTGVPGIMKFNSVNLQFNFTAGTLESIAVGPWTIDFYISNGTVNYANTSSIQTRPIAVPGSVVPFGTIDLSFVNTSPLNSFNLMARINGNAALFQNSVINYVCTYSNNKLIGFT